MTRKEAMEIVKRLYNNSLFLEKDKEAMSTLVPELVESEDERIRKDIIALIELFTDGSAVSPGSRTTKEEALEWLEKQKEEEGYEAIPVESTLEYKLGFKAGKESEKQKEQKPAEWDEDTKTNLDRALQIIKKAKGTLQGYQSDDGIYECDKAIECLEHFLYRGLEIEKSVEWSKDYREEAIQTRFAFYTYKDEPSVLYLSNVFVEKACRTPGYGTRILKATEKVAEVVGATTIRLKVKQESLANAWYRKNGYSFMTFEDGYNWLEKNIEYIKPNKQEWSEEDENKIERLAFLVSVAEEKEMISPSESIDLRNLIKSLRPRSKQEQQIKEGDKVSIHCRKDRREDITITYDGEVGEVIHVWDAKKHPWGHIIVQLNNGCNTGFYEDELEVLDEPHWKPSEEQITAVKAAYSVLNSYDTWDEDEHLPTLMSLINDLQKLL